MSLLVIPFKLKVKSHYSNQMFPLLKNEKINRKEKNEKPTAV